MLFVRLPLSSTDRLSFQSFSILLLNRYGSTSLLCKAQSKFGINGNLSIHLSDGSIYHSAFLDTVGGRDATSEDFGDSCYTIFIMFLWHHLGRSLCRLLFSILE